MNVCEPDAVYRISVGGVPVAAAPPAEATSNQPSVPPVSARPLLAETLSVVAGVQR